jgi:hypothetical protein
MDILPRFGLVSTSTGVNPYGERNPTMKIGRNAGDGRFVPVKVAQQRPATHVVETIKRPPPPPPAKPAGGKSK